ncbi:MAG: GNAT family N-acetyltransferase [Pseudomonadota bacterium]
MTSANPGCRTEPPRNPADLDAWDDAVVSTYALRRQVVQSSTLTARLFQAGPRRLLANAPYLEYGGIAGGDVPLTSADLCVMDEARRAAAAPALLLKSDRLLTEPSTAVAVDDRYVSFTLELDRDAQALWRDALDGKTRNQVRKAERGDFTVRFGGADMLVDFQRVITEVWRDLGTPSHAARLFSRVAETFGPACRVPVVYDGAVPVAAALLLEVNGTLHHPFAGTRRSYRHTSVNNLLYWRIIRDACERGLHTFDLGRSAPDAGTYRFKKSWGATPRPLFYHYLVARGDRAPSLETAAVRIATRAWKYCPLWLSRQLGPKLIRYIL